MNIRTSKVPVDLRKLTKIAIKFYVENFMITKVAERIDEILVKFSSFGGADDIMATADYEEDGYSKYPSDYIIEFADAYRDIKVEHYLRTIFHEMTHVRQYAQGRLTYKDDKHVFERVIYKSTLNYWMHPWEWEAHGLEKCAYELFVLKFPEYENHSNEIEYNGRTIT